MLKPGRDWSSLNAASREERKGRKGAVRGDEITKDYQTLPKITCFRFLSGKLFALWNFWN